MQVKFPFANARSFTTDQLVSLARQASSLSQASHYQELQHLLLSKIIGGGPSSCVRVFEQLMTGLAISHPEEVDAEKVSEGLRHLELYGQSKEIDAALPADPMHEFRFTPSSPSEIRWGSSIKEARKKKAAARQAMVQSIVQELDLKGYQRDQLLQLAREIQRLSSRTEDQPTAESQDAAISLEAENIYRSLRGKGYDDQVIISVGHVIFDQAFSLPR